MTIMTVTRLSPRPRLTAARHPFLERGEALVDVPVDELDLPEDPGLVREGEGEEVPVRGGAEVEVQPGDGQVRIVDPAQLDVLDVGFFGAG